ncbi:MAG: hypothetical protein WD934_09110 [Gemmatimonadales bacterium]
MTQNDLVHTLRTLLATARRRPREVAGGLTPAQRQWRPPTGGWGVDEVLEHIQAIDEPYLHLLRHWAAQSGPVAEPDEPWSGRWGGRLLVWSFQRERSRWPTLKAYRVVTYHALRHYQQIERILAHPAFPA